VLVFQRDKYRCVVSQFPETKTLPKWPECFGGLTVHHVHKASGGGPYTEDNLVTLCAFHNEYVESHHLEAQALGLEVRP
jgi:5-methylcytosine-specific restriction endonuclease McrA